MAYTELPTYTTNQLITAAHGNTYWRDNINELWPFTDQGDVAYASAATTLDALAIGSVGSVLKSTGSIPAWDALERILHWRIVPVTVSVSKGNLQDIITIPPELNGCNLVFAGASVNTVSSSGTPTVQIRNVTDGVDMLTTAITIDADEKTSFNAETAAVIDTAHDDVATGDEITCDVDVAGTGTKGLVVHLVFALP